MYLFPKSRKSESHTQLINRVAAALLAFLISTAFFAAIHSSRANAQASQYYTMQEVVDAGHVFFGTTSGALATAVENAFSKHGMPNGYILGEEAAGAFIGGLRYGEGMMYTKNAGDHKVYWQGPSVGLDYGINGSRTMVLVYNLPTVDFIYNRFYGVSGAAYAIGGLGVTALTRSGVHLVPISTGIGAHLGINVRYLKLSRVPRINPF